MTTPTHTPPDGSAALGARLPHATPMRRETSPQLEGEERAPQATSQPAPPLRIPAGLPAASSMPLQVAKLAIWPFLEQILGFLVGFTDTALAGHISPEATTGAGAAGHLAWLINLLFGAVGVGATALVARAVGAGRWGRANRILTQSLLMAGVCGCLVGGFFFWAAPWAARLTGLEGRSLELGTLFLRILSVAAPCNAILGLGNACLRGSGNTRSPFFIMIVVNLINIGASVALVWERSPIGGHGLAGVALGTALAWFGGLGCILYVLALGKGPLALDFAFLRPRLAYLLRIVRVGGPNLLENIGHWGGNFLVLRMVAELAQPYAIGAHHLVIRLEAISFLPGFAVGMAASTLAGQYLGARDPRKARQAVCWCWLFGVLLMTSYGVLFLTIPALFVRLVTDEPVFLEACPRLLFHAGWSQASFATYLVLSAAMRGAGDTRSALLMTFGSTFLVRLPCVYLLSQVLDWGLAGVWIALSGELCCRGFLFLARFHQGGWMRARP